MLPDTSLHTGSSGGTGLRYMKTRTEMPRNGPGASAVPGESRGSGRLNILLGGKQPWRTVLQVGVDGNGSRADP